MHLPLIVKNNIDFLMISETKLEDSFPTAQFLLDGYSASIDLAGTRKVVEPQ